MPQASTCGSADVAHNNRDDPVEIGPDKTISIDHVDHGYCWSYATLADLHKVVFILSLNMTAGYNVSGLFLFDQEAKVDVLQLREELQKLSLAKQKKKPFTLVDIHDDERKVGV